MSLYESNSKKQRRFLLPARFETRVNGSHSKVGSCLVRKKFSRGSRKRKRRFTAKKGSKRSRKRKVIQAIEVVNEQSLQESSSQSGSDCIVVGSR
jgi:hypothetical protein